MLTVNLMGGLGNKLFQLAGLEHICKKTGRTPVVIRSFYGKDPHSTADHHASILKEWPVLDDNTYLRVVHEPHNIYFDNWSTLLNGSDSIRLFGYFQDWHYVDDSFKEKLRFSDEIAKRYPNVRDRVFIHIRGGDYVGNRAHDLNLDNYYRKAINMFPSNTQFYIFTNDLPYARSKSWLPSINHTFIIESEVDSLYLMSLCSGGICANSSFGWWGAYLNPNRKIVMPDIWFAGGDFCAYRYHFPGVIVCPVEQNGFNSVKIIDIIHNKNELTRTQPLP